MIGTEIKRIQFLDRLYDFRPRRQGEMAAVADLVGGHLDQDERDVWNSVLHQLAASGKIILAESMFDGDLVSLLGPGRAEVEQRRKRRDDSAARRTASRDAVLGWIAKHPGQATIDAITTDLALYFEGEPLGKRDLGMALSYLHQQGLVTGNRVAETTLIDADLTAKGRAHITDLGGVMPNDRETRRMGGNTTHNINFHGPVSGNVAWSNQSVTQSATTSGLAGEELSVLIGAVLQSVQTLNLPSRDTDSLRSDLGNVEDELRSRHPDENIVATYLGRAMKTLARQGGNALALVLGAYTKQLLQQLGLPAA